MPIELSKTQNEKDTIMRRIRLQSLNGDIISQARTADQNHRIQLFLAD